MLFTWVVAFDLVQTVKTWFHLGKLNLKLVQCRVSAAPGPRLQLLVEAF